MSVSHIILYQDIWDITSVTQIVIKVANKFDQKVEALFSKEGRKITIISIKKEMQKAIDKENYLSEEEKLLINNFILKIKSELNSVKN